MTTQPADTSATPLDPAEFPLPFGIEAETGDPIPGITDADLDRIDSDGKEVQERSVCFAIADVDPNNLEEAGWCVVFSSEADPGLKAALAPLLAHRESQAKGLFKVFEGAAGIRSGDDVRSWIERHGAGLSVVEPRNGIPLYVLIVGSPDRISFEFQYLLDMYWNVGRVHFDTADEYRAYADSVVDYETSARVPHRKHAAMWVTKNDGDRPTGLLHDTIAVPLATGAPGVRALAGFKGFELSTIFGESATKAALVELLSGRASGGAPAFLFTGSHGVRFKMENPAQRENVGALLCQDWPGFGPTTPEHLFAAADIPADAKVHGLIHFLFACYGGGCPKEDNFGLGSGQQPRQLVAQPIVSRLPQRLLARGALASLAHVDRAWAYAFQNSRSMPQVQEMRDVMVRLLMGHRIGQATDGFNMRWGVLAAELQEAQNLRGSLNDQLASNALLANRYVARNDARNYIVLGDPAVRLRTEAMTV